MAGKYGKSFNSVQPPVKAASYVVWDQTTVALINQNALHLEQQLTAFAQDTRRNDTNTPMRTIAGLLTPEEMKSLAFAYSGGLEGSR